MITMTKLKVLTVGATFALSNNTTLPPLSPVARCCPSWSNSTADIMSAVEGDSRSVVPKQAYAKKIMSIYCRCDRCILRLAWTILGLFVVSLPSANRKRPCKRLVRSRLTFLNVLSWSPLSEALEKIPVGIRGCHRETFVAPSQRLSRTSPMTWIQ